MSPYKPLSECVADLQVEVHGMASELDDAEVRLQVERRARRNAVFLRDGYWVRKALADPNPTKAPRPSRTREGAPAGNQNGRKPRGSHVGWPAVTDEEVDRLLEELRG